MHTFHQIDMRNTIEIETKCLLTGFIVVFFPLFIDSFITNFNYLDIKTWTIETKLSSHIIIYIELILMHEAVTTVTTVFVINIRKEVAENIHCCKYVWYDVLCSLFIQVS